MWFANDTITKSATIRVTQSKSHTYRNKYTHIFVISTRNMRTRLTLIVHFSDFVLCVALSVSVFTIYIVEHIHSNLFGVCVWLFPINIRILTISIARRTKWNYWGSAWKLRTNRLFRCLSLYYMCYMSWCLCARLLVREKWTKETIDLCRGGGRRQRDIESMCERYTKR